MKTSPKDRAEIHDRLARLGFNYEEACALRRISMTLHRWAELECGDGNDRASWSIERDEQTGKPYMVTHPHNGKSYRRAIPDREAGALKRLAGIMARHPELVSYHQTDPRGAALYVVNRAELGNRDLSSNYTIGTCIY